MYNFLKGESYMKCLCFSDSHGTSDYMRRALKLHPDAEVIFFLGDGLSDAEELLYDKSRAWLAVKGNCDYISELGGAFVKKLDSITLLGKKIVFTHGDLYGVKYGTDGIISLAKEQGADIVLFGHTHIPFEKYIPSEDEGGIYLFNPGSIGVPYRSNTSYGVINITDDGVIFSHGGF